MIGKISARQLMLIVATIAVSSTVVVVPAVKYGDARQDAWIAAIISTLASCLVAILSTGLAERFPGKSLGQFSKEVLGPHLGWVVIGLVSLSLYVISLAKARLVSLVVVSHFMPRTPGWAIVVPMLAVALYGSVTGPDTIGRSAEVMFTMTIGVSILMIALLHASKAVPQTSLRPILAHGLKPVLAASVSPASLGVVSGSTVLALGRFTKRPSSLTRAVVMGLLISGIILVVMTLYVLTTIGHDQAESSVAPLLALAGAINIEGVVERADLPILTVWMLGVTFEVTVLLMSAAIIIGDALSASYKVVAAVLFGIGVIPVSHRVTDLFSLRLLLSIPVSGTWALVVFVGAIGATLIAVLRKERRRPRS